jgi:hypothetical protein
MIADHTAVHHRRLAPRLGRGGRPLTPRSARYADLPRAARNWTSRPARAW